MYTLAIDKHSHDTRYACNDLLPIPTCNTLKYGTRAFVFSTIPSWSFFQTHFSSKNLREILHP